MNSNKKQQNTSGNTSALKAELQRTRKELKELKDRFKLFSIADIDAVFISLKGMCVDQNDQAERMFGYTMEEAYGRMGTDWIIPEDRPAVMDNMLSGHDQPYQVNALRKDGSVFPCELIGRMIEFKGELYRVTTLKDISNRERIEQYANEQQSLAQQSLAQQYLDVAGVMLLGLDIDGNVTLINQKGCEILGMSREEIVGRNWIDNFVPKRFTKPVTGVANKVFRGLMEGNENYENPVLTNNGDEKIIAWHNAALRDESGQVIGTISSGLDLTKTKRQEVIRQVVFDIANAVNTSADLADLNKRIYELLSRIIDTTNYFVALKTDDQDFMDVAYMVDSEDVFDHIPLKDTLSGYVVNNDQSLLLVKGRSLSNKLIEELPVIGAASKVWLGVPLRSQGKVIGIIAVQSYTDDKAYDETDQEVLEYVSSQIGLAIERKRSQDALKKALSHAEESDRLKSAFLANVSHEIRTPLNSILGFSDLLQDSDLEDEMKDNYLRIIQSGGAQLKTIIDDIINISLIESGQLQVNRESFSVIGLMQSLYDEHRTEAENKGLTLKLTSTDETWLNSDQMRLRQILTNLLTNAFKYSDEGDILIGHEIVKEEVVFFVKDQGRGIAPEDHQKIFERFIRIENRDSIIKGTGLGLPIVKALVDNLGGRIWLNSAEGKGSEFFFSIPLN